MSNEDQDSDQQIISGVSSTAIFNGKSNTTAQPNGVPANDMRKVVLFTGNNGTSHAVLNTLIPDLLSAGIEPIVLLTPGTNSPKAKIQGIQDFSFFETGLLNSVYDYLENSYPITNGENEPRKNTFYSPEQLAHFYNVHVSKINDVNDPELATQISSDNSIIGSVSIKNYKLFCGPAIETLKENGKFLWNVHTGELPSYRGVFIPVRTMLDGNPEYGWTLHDIDEGIDTGALIDIRTRHLKEGSTALGAYFSMVKKGSDMISDNIKLAAKKMQRSPIPQDHGQARYFSFPTQEDIQSLEDGDPPRHLYNEENAIERYLHMFSDPHNHADHANGLYLMMQSAIADYKSGRNIQQRPDLYIEQQNSAGNTADL